MFSSRRPDEGRRGRRTAITPANGDSLTAAHGTVGQRRLVLVQIRTEAGEGWGECVALNTPAYNGESSDHSFDALVNDLAPRLVQSSAVDGSDLDAVLGPCPHLQSARAAIEMALLDIELRSQGIALSDHLSVVIDHVDVCVVLGINDVVTTVAQARALSDEGVRHLKLKVQPGLDLQVAAAVRDALPHIALRIDANGSYSWGETSHRRTLVALGEYDLAFIEQPFAAGDTESFRSSRGSFSVPIAVDESVSSLQDGIDCIQSELIDAIVVKPGNVGGMRRALQLGAAAAEGGVTASVGGMIEAGISRAVSATIAATKGFAAEAAELSGDGRWFAGSIIQEPVSLIHGTFPVPHGPGLGVTPDLETIEALVSRSATVSR